MWIHGASVGEVLAASALIERLRDLGFTVLLTSGAVTSAEIAARRFGNDVIRQFMPYDFPRFHGRASWTHGSRRSRCSWSHDIWPNMIMAASRRRIPMMIVNGRLSAALL